MKAEELMIGDIVMFPHGIDTVRDIVFVDGKGMCASFAASATLFPVEVDKLIPFALNVAHLLQLDFKRIDDETFVLETTNACCKCVFRYNIGSKVLHINDGFIPEPICNVHQLQHAMRLCNIKWNLV